MEHMLDSEEPMEDYTFIIDSEPELYMGDMDEMEFDIYWSQTK